MDPFTERMLERARARREKLDTQLSNAGHDVRKYRTPLKDANIATVQAQGQTKTQSPTKATVLAKSSPGKSPSKSPQKLSISKESVNEGRGTNKENGDGPVSNIRSKLQRLGKLYSEDGSRELSSPIHRTEEKFSAEDESSSNKSTKPGARLGRLAVLASTINNWEDDLHHVTGDSNMGKSTSPSKWITNAGRSKTNSPCANEKNDVNSPKSITSSSYSSPRTPDRTGSKNGPTSKSVETKTKDPAEMTLCERMALFERNKEKVPLLPKAPLTSSVPVEKLQENKRVPTITRQERENPISSNRSKFEMNSNSVTSRCAVFEQGNRVQEMENNILKDVQSERQREMEMLRSRFNKNKEVAQVAAGSCIRTSESSEGKSSSSKNSPVCPVKPTPAPDLVPPPPPPPPQTLTVTPKNSSPIRAFQVNKRKGDSSPKSQPSRQLVNTNAKTSASTDHRLYPDLSILQSTETETETEFTIGTTESDAITLDDKTDTDITSDSEYSVQREDDASSTQDSDSITNTSLGRSILHAVGHQSALKKKRSIEPDPDSVPSDTSALDEMEYLDEYTVSFGNNGREKEGPTPAKLNKGGRSPSTPHANSKNNQRSPYRSPIKTVSPSTPNIGEPCVVEGDSYVPLKHSISFYRRQQSQTPKTPIRFVSRTTESEVDSSGRERSRTNGADEAILVQDKIKRLLDEVCKQQTIIGQASQALNLCSSTIEFSGSREQVEGERLLLVANQRRQAALNEIQRLKVEGTLHPVTPGTPEIQESGSLTISAISLPLKPEYFRKIEPDTCLHFVCLVRHLENVVTTPAVLAETGDYSVRFPSTLKLQDLYSDFKVTIEIYSLETRAEILPHEIKYHIHNSGSGSGAGSSSKKSSGKTPKKLLKQESNLVMPAVYSPGGPSAVRTPAFSPAGYVVFSLREVNRQQFTLNKVPRLSPLVGKLQMHVSCELSVSVEHRGFLTMFEDISGFGAWHRRWCLLKNGSLSYWKYPDDERKKEPIGVLDLRDVTTIDVNLVSRDICARPHTFLLETVRPAHPNDTDTLITIRNGSETTERHLLSADTKEDRLEWCAKLNKTLTLVRTWGGASNSS
ncbi:anillin isoform X2 [Orussus abietinus]|uniref:anillin isoform X2 n=1 Tax=Orussus abietinus TaxID=222816 RepID=UPI000C715BC4|nr:anillin isoform X2 [Orussus abietinus]